METVLRSFSRYTLEHEYAGSLTMDIVLAWVTSSGEQTNKTMGRKLEAIKPFSKYASAFDPEAVCITDKIFRNTHTRPEPYIYPENEVILLMNHCDGLCSAD